MAIYIRCWLSLLQATYNESVEMLRKAWNEVSPSMPFDYSFLDEDVARQYASYDRWMNIMGFSTAFAILISSPWAVWTLWNKCNQSNKRNWNSKSNGCRDDQHLCIVEQAICLACCDCICPCRACLVVRDASSGFLILNSL